jgi:hypothetical protein
MPLLGLAFIIAYAGGAWKFWSGFHRTNYQQGRLYLTALWPLLLMANRSYRQNFNKALKG